MYVMPLKYGCNHLQVKQVFNEPKKYNSSEAGAFYLSKAPAE